MKSSEPMTTNQAHPPGCINIILLIGIWLGVIAISFGSAATELLVTSVAYSKPDYYWAIFPLIQGMLMLVWLSPFAFFWPYQRLRGIFKSWLWISMLIFVYIPLRFSSATASNNQALLHILLGLMFIGVLLLNQVRKGKKHAQDEVTNGSTGRTKALIKDRAQAFTIFLAGVVCGMFWYPWLAWGAFGSLLDTLLGLFVGVIFGAIAALVMAWHLIPSILENSLGFNRDYLLASFAAGTILLILASATGFSYGSMRIVLMICLPALGWIAIGLAFFSHSTPSKTSIERRNRTTILPLMTLVGLSAAAPLALIDPDELFFLLSAFPGEIFYWALYAAGLSAGIALLAGLVFFILIKFTTRHDPPITIRPAFIGSFTLLVWIIAACIYFVAGQPGFYGEGLFVIFNDQADLGAARQITDPLERRQYVYQTLVTHANDSQASIRLSLDRFGIKHTPYYLVNGLYVRAGPVVRWWLSTRPEVNRVLDNPWMRPLPHQLPYSTGSETAPVSTSWNLNMINAERVWQDLDITGEGIVIGQSDSGVQSDHPELAPNYRGRNGDHNFNWYDPWYGTLSPEDTLGHGTHSLGIVAGQNVGVAPGASWIACVNLARNLGNPALYLDCLQFVFAPYPLAGDPLRDGDPDLGAQVLNNSWECPNFEGCDVMALSPAVSALDIAGVFVVTSAGNEGPGCSTLSAPIAIYPESFTVGAVDRYKNLAFFSSLGPVTVDNSGRIKPDIVAPGDQVLSAMPGSTYGTRSGTSFSSPHVAGVVALMWSANPELIGENQITRQILAETAQPYDGPLPDCPGANLSPSTAVGYGIVDAYAAVQKALSFTK